MPKYSRHSHHARRALTHARSLARRYRHPYVDTAHVLVGVMMTEGSIGCRVLLEMNLYAEKAEVQLQALYPMLDDPRAQVHADEALNMTLQLAADEAAWLSHHYIGTEHLLLGITRANTGNAPALLRRMGASSEHLRRRVRRALTEGATEFDLQTAKQVAQLSELSRRVINAAELRATTLEHETVGLGHLLLELAQESRSPTAQALRDCGLDDKRLRQDLEQASPILLVTIDGMMAQVIDLVGQVGSHYIGTEHLLHVLAQDAAGSAALRAYGVDPTVLEHRLNLK